MRVAINLEFTDDEIRKYAEDVSRRWTLNLIHDGIAHLAALKVNPDLVSALGQAAALGFNAAMKKHTASEPSAPPVGQAYTMPKGCKRTETSPYADGGWWCCACMTQNNENRSACRGCAHERCDVVVTPPPNAETPA